MTQDIFIRCQKFTYDKVWQNMFYNCSLGKFPTGVTMSTHSSASTLSYKGKSITLGNDDKSCMEIIEFMKGIFNTDSTFSTVSKADTAPRATIEWKNIKKETRERMINDYITRFAKQHDLSKYDMKTAESTIHLGFQMGTLTNDNIIIEKGCDFISNIEGFEYEIVDGVKTFTTPMIKSSLPSNAGTNANVTTSSIRNKYLNYIEKYVRNQNNRSIFQ